MIFKYQLDNNAELIIVIIPHNLLEMSVMVYYSIYPLI